MERLLEAQTTEPTLPVDKRLHRRRIYAFMFLTAWLEPAHMWLETIIADEILSRARREPHSLRVELKGYLKEIDQIIRVLRTLNPPYPFRASLNFPGLLDAMDESYQFAVASALDQGKEAPTLEAFQERIRFRRLSQRPSTLNTSQESCSTMFSHLQHHSPQPENTHKTA